MRSAVQILARLLIPAAVLVPGLADAQTAGSGTLGTAVDSIVQASLKDGPIAGTSVAITRGGRVLVAKGYGFADLENDVPATSETVYRIGSITKQFTAAAIMRLAEQGKIGLEDEITKFLPDYPLQGHRVLVRHLLNHTSGIRSYTSLGPKWQSKMRLDLSHDSLVALFQNEPFDFAPGDGWRYDNSGYYLLGMIIEKVSGMGYGDYLAKNFFKPLGLDGTYYCETGPIIRHRAQGYEVRKRHLVNAQPLSMTQPFAAGSLCSTVGDLVKWQGALEDGRVISAASYHRMVTPDTLNNGKRLEYGFGLGVGALDGHRLIAHGGGINGFLTQLSRFPDDSLTVVVLTNTEAGNPEGLAKRIARRALGLPEPVARNIALTSADLADFAGTFVRGDFKIRLARNGNTLQLETPDGDTTPLFYQGGGRFAGAKDRELELVLAPAGTRADTLTLFQSGHQVLVAIRAP